MNEEINIVESLKTQRAHLERLLDAKIWISSAPQATHEEMEAQIEQIRRILIELETLIKKHCE